MKTRRWRSRPHRPTRARPIRRRRRPRRIPFVDNVASNQRGDARYATAATNAGVRVLIGMLDIWKPLTEIVDAGVTAPAVAGFPAVTIGLDRRAE